MSEIILWGFGNNQSIVTLGYGNYWESIFRVMRLISELGPGESRIRRV